MTMPFHRKAVPSLLAILLPLVTLAACSSYNGSHPGTTYPYLSGVTLQPSSSPSIVVTGTVLVGASGAYQNSATEITYTDVTGSATWGTSNAAVATVDKGLVTGTGIGSGTITASFNGKQGTTLVVVGQTPTLQITSTKTFSLSANPDQQFQVSASYSDSSVLDLTNYVTWDSSAPGVLKFFDPTDYLHSPGEATLLETGMTTVTATTLETGDVGSLDVTVIP
jgi:hypothetical protein